MKKIRKFLALLGAFCVIGSANAFAYAVDNPGEDVEPDPSTRTNVTINIESPDVYEGTLEFYCGLETYYLSIPLGETNTSYDLNLAKGVSKIAVLDPDDVGNSFTLTYDKTLDTDKQKEFDIVMTYSESSTEVSEDELDAPDDIGSVAEPTTYDFSDGQEYGTISVSCAQYGSVDSVKFSLMGKKVYEVTLNNDNGYQANLLLPAGSYRELTKIDVTTNEFVTNNDKLSFAWGHRNGSYFGNNYNLSVGEQISINDLIIKMNYDGDLREIDDDILMGAKINSMYTDIKNDRREEFLKEELPEKLDLDVTEPETTAAEIAEAVAAESGNGMWKTIAIAGVIIIGIAAIAIVVKIRKETED